MFGVQPTHMCFPTVISILTTKEENVATFHGEISVGSTSSTILLLVVFLM